MQTGNRWEGNANPRDLTRVRQQKLLSEKAAREKADSEVIDVAAIREAGRQDGFSQGWDRAYAWIIDRMTTAGIDPDILAVGRDDEDQADEQEAV